MGLGSAWLASQGLANGTGHVPERFRQPFAFLGNPGDDRTEHFPDVPDDGFRVRSGKDGQYPALRAYHRAYHGVFRVVVQGRFGKGLAK